MSSNYSIPIQEYLNIPILYRTQDDSSLFPQLEISSGPRALASRYSQITIIRVLLKKRKWITTVKADCIRCSFSCVLLPLAHPQNPNQTPIWCLVGRRRSSGSCWKSTFDTLLSRHRFRRRVLGRRILEDPYGSTPLCGILILVCFAKIFALLRILCVAGSILRWNRVGFRSAYLIRKNLSAELPSSGVPAAYPPSSDGSLEQHYKLLIFVEYVYFRLSCQRNWAYHK